MTFGETYIHGKACDIMNRGLCAMNRSYRSASSPSAWHNGGAEQLPLFDSPASGIVLATHQGAQQECNRPDQLRQCRNHCYSDLGFLLPVKASPPL